VNVVRTLCGRGWGDCVDSVNNDIRDNELVFRAIWRARDAISKPCHQNVERFQEVDNVAWWTQSL